VQQPQLPEQKVKSRIRLGDLDRSGDPHYRDSLEVVGLMRRHRYSLRRASRDVGIDPRTVRRYAGGALVQRRGRYAAKLADRLPRTLAFFDASGDQIELTTRSSKTASLVARYHNSLRSYAQYGDATALREFEGKTITVGGKRHNFMTDTRQLSRLIRAGELRVQDIYGSGGLHDG
jgi:hypothetical protein